MYTRESIPTVGDTQGYIPTVRDTQGYIPTVVHIWERCIPTVVHIWERCIPTVTHRERGRSIPTVTHREREGIPTVVHTGSLPGLLRVYISLLLPSQDPRGV